MDFFTHLKISIGFLKDLAAKILSGRFANNPNLEEISQKSLLFLILKPSAMTKNHIYSKCFPEIFFFQKVQRI